MKRRLITLVLVSIAAFAAVLSAGAATAAAPPPPPNDIAALTAFWPNLTSLTGNKAAYGSFDVYYSIASQRLTWSIDYTGTTGPATDLRVRMRLTHGILSLSLCKPGCSSKQLKSSKGPYFHMGGTIVRPPRDLLLMATAQGGADLIVTTTQYPRGELRSSVEQNPPPAASSGGHCC
jgi:hypothetical protein